MSHIVICDWCGEEIESHEAVTLNATGARRSGWENGWAAHYHGDECFAEVRDALDLIRSVGTSLESLPTTGPALGNKHRPWDDEYQRRADAGTPLYELLNRPVAGALRSRNLVTLEEVAQLPAQAVSEIDGVGPDTMRILAAALTVRGMGFAEDRENAGAS